MTASIDIPQSVISGLLRAVQAQPSDAEVCLSHTHLAVLPNCDLFVEVHPVRHHPYATRAWCALDQPPVTGPMWLGLA